MVTIYALKDPRDGQIRYVGKTKLKISKRLSGHRNEKGTTRKCRWLATLTKDSLEPEVIVLEEVLEEEWESAECFWIDYCRRSGFDLTNLTDGGDGVHNPSQESRNKLSIFQKKRFEDPEERRKLSENKERSAKISKALTGKKKSKEHVAKLIQNQPGRKLSEEAKGKVSKSLLGNSRRLGIPHTENTKKQISLSLRGNKSRTGQIQSLEERKKKSDATKGIPKSEEMKALVRQKQLSYWGKMTKEERRAELLARLNKKKKESSPDSFTANSGEENVIK